MAVPSLLTWIFNRIAAFGAHSRLQPEAQVQVTFDDREIVCAWPEGARRTARWADLTEVHIVTTSEGPWAPDVFWILFSGGPEASVVYPQGATGDPALLEAMQHRLPGFDDEAVIRAMGSTDDARFVVWRRAATADG